VKSSGFGRGFFVPHCGATLSLIGRHGWGRDAYWRLVARADGLRLNDDVHDETPVGVPAPAVPAAFSLTQTVPPFMAAPTKNTVQFYPWHHFVLLPLALLMAGYTILRYTKVAGDDDQIARLWFSIAVLAVIGLGVLVMLRQHYALQLQDRVCRLEVRQRYFEVSGQRFAPLEKQLSLSQLLSLRLAGDAELPALAQAAATEKLSPKDIQARITDFQFDTMRV
jgi:hypothetical protein